MKREYFFDLFDFGKRFIKMLFIYGKNVGNNMNDYKLVMFDMDGTILRGRGIFVIAEKKGFLEELIRLIRDNSMEFYERSIAIGELSKGYSYTEFLEIFRNVPLQNNIEKVINELKKRKIKTAIATDSYQFLADDLKNRLGMDYAFGNNLITNDGIITGELEIHNKDLKKDFNSDRVYSICKSCVLEELCDNLKITVGEAIAIGDGIVDTGMIQRAGLGIAFNASEEVNKKADVVTNDLSKILEYI
jgi:phosphoserine phosphatase